MAFYLRFFFLRYLSFVPIDWFIVPIIAVSCDCALCPLIGWLPPLLLCHVTALCAHWLADCPHYCCVMWLCFVPIDWLVVPIIAVSCECALCPLIGWLAPLLLCHVTVFCAHWLVDCPIIVTLMGYYCGCIVKLAKAQRVFVCLLSDFFTN
jgi:putative Mn2+ efflux pump MntP